MRGFCWGPLIGEFFQIRDLADVIRCSSRTQFISVIISYAFYINIYICHVFIYILVIFLNNIEIII